MAIYEMSNSKFTKLKETTFSERGIHERRDLQRLLRDQIEIICPDTLVISEEYGEWEDSRRRIDLLGIDNNAKLVVIELKRTEDGGHMELQAIRYASMITNLTFDDAVSIYGEYLSRNQISDDPEQKILSFLRWDEPNEDEFAKEVRIVLASAEFSKEITSSVLWLREYGLDIVCVRLQPYFDGFKTLLDVQTVIPLPETEQYQVQIRKKQQQEKQSRDVSRDLTKYNLYVDKVLIEKLAKRNLVFHVVHAVIQSGATPLDVSGSIPWKKNTLFASFDGVLDSEQFCEELLKQDSGGRHPLTRRYFCKDGELFHSDGRTYALSNQWGARTEEAVELIIKAFPKLGLRIEVSR